MANMTIEDELLIGRFLGRPVYVSPFLVDTKTVPRTWRERFLTWPWRPWRKTKTVEAPSNQILDMAGKGFVVHPAKWEEMRKTLGQVRDATRIRAGERYQA